MDEWRVQIPGWVPVSLNQLIGNHAKAARLKQRDARVIAQACAIHRVPPVGLDASEKAHRKALDIVGRQPGDPTPIRRHVRLEIKLGKGERACDEDNYFKSLMDGLKRSGMLFEDNRQWATHDSRILFSRGGDSWDRGAVIVLRNLEGLP
jgi:hypothetical protein